MANQNIPGLPAVTTLTGLELVWVVQSGVDSRATTSQIATLQNDFLLLEGVTVGTLPAMNPAGGQLAYVTDATSLVNGSVVLGGGSFSAMVKSDGRNWIVLG